MQEDKDVTLDFTKIKKFFRKDGKFNRIRPYLLLLIPLFLCLFLRMQPTYLHITDDWAETSVRNFYSNQIKSQIAQEINSQYAFLPSAERDALINNMVNEQLDDMMRSQKDLIESQITDLSLQFKSKLRDNNGHTYLVAIDPYMHYRLSKNLYETGFFGDELKNGTIPWNNRMMAPEGRRANLHLHHYVGVYAHDFLRFFNKDLNYMGTFFYIPVIFSLITIIPAFFIARRYAGDLGALFAAIIVAIHPAFLTRTAGGFADTDVYNIMFPLLIAWFVLIAVETKDKRTMYSFGILSGILTGIYAFTWTGWWYVFDFLLGSIIAYLGYALLKNRLKTGKFEYRQVVYLLVTYFGSSLIFVTLFKSFGFFMNAFKGPFNFLSIQTASHVSLWPNVYTTVAELNVASLKAIVNNIGGPFLLVIALLGIAFALTSKKGFKKSDYIVMTFALAWYVALVSLVATINQMPNGRYIFILGLLVPVALGAYYAIVQRKDVNFKISILLALWFIGTIYAATNGIRFVMLLVPALGIAIGIFIGRVYRFLNMWIEDMKINSILTRSVVMILLALILIQPMSIAYNTARNEIPSMNDAWYDALTAIKEDSREDAIINSWWDFGHWFKAIADRKVTFDGASQNSPQAHWIGKVLLTDDETEAIAILRMLDCGGNRAFDILNSELQDTETSVDIIKEAIMLDSDGALSFLGSYVDASVADRIISRTHCDPPENYFIASEDMVGKAGVWAHFGSWNFDRAWLWTNIKGRSMDAEVQSIMDRFGYDRDAAQDLYYEVISLEDGRDANTWISPWPGYVTNLAGCTNQGEDEPFLVCNNGVMINMSGEISAYLSLDQGLVVPDSLVYPVEDGLEKIVFNSPNKVPYSIALVPEGSNTFRTIVMDKALAESMFTRMFFFRGQGLAHFNLFNTQSSFTGESIYVFKVDWQGYYPEKLDSEVRASHILVGSEELADEIYQRIQDGEDFGNLAQNYSIDGSAASGGDLGYFGTGIMVSKFEDAVAKLGVGEVSDPVQTQFGWHIIKVTDIREELDVEMPEDPESSGAVIIT